MKRLQKRFNALLLQFKRYQNKLNRLELLGKNERRQSLLKKRLDQLERTLSSLHIQIKRTALTSAIAAAAILATTSVNAQTLDFEEVTPSPFDPIDVGILSTPALADIDGDGDMDLLVGNYTGDLRYYTNEGNFDFQQQVGVDNPFSLINVGMFPRPVFVDWDDDGDMDLVVGTYGYYEPVTLFYYENVDGEFTQQSPAPFGDLSIYNSDYNTANPSFGDLDGDGDLDMLIGDYYGDFYYYENDNGTLVEGDYPQLEDIDVGDFSHPALGDPDGDGDLDLLAGHSSGFLRYFENTNGDFSELTGAASPFNGVDAGGYSMPLWVDIDNDSDLDVVVGLENGTIKLFRNTEFSDPCDDDQIAPVFDESTLPDALVQRQVMQGNDYVVEDFTDGVTATDNCTITITQNLAAGTEVGPGVYDMTLTVTDVNQNTDTHDFQLEVIEILGVATHELESLSLYPNPTSNNVYINNPNSINIDKVELFDVTGKKILEFIPVSNDIHIPITQVTEGLYVLKATTEHGIWTNQLMVE